MKSKFFNIFSRYPIYFIVGGFVTLVTIVLRDFIGRFLYGSAWEYVMSIAIVYVVGTILSYFLQSRFTFKDNKKKTRSFKYKFSYYTVVQLLGMGVTIVFSLLIRYLLFPITILAQFRDTIAFIIASLIASIVTYGISKVYIFKEISSKK
ncbi:GtrA family protein [Pseudanabaena yagii]|uniref:GtrA family protein n=1 Tax=Pseudanabaena yagii GIHE-NHR1 TaxID=2722753 RepID=A0ABX1LWI2_9CYAN|nr:GtrA family protein [Pseudanabaena yagii]NMF60557.1 GtrA family protein [Pseudanabaena yagii GIHE-NHR1]